MQKKGDFDFAAFLDYRKKLGQSEEGKKPASNEKSKNVLVQAGRQMFNCSPAPMPKSKEGTSSLIQQLSNLQKVNSSLRAELNQTESKKSKLQNELNWHKANLKSDSKGQSDNKGLEAENKKLEAKLEKFKQLLKQKNLKWNQDQGIVIEVQKPLTKIPTQINIVSLRRRIQQLNHNLRQEGNLTQMVADQRGIVRMRQKQAIVLGIFQDGLIFQGYCFYKYASKEGARILNDIMDGYFPYILKAKHSQGTLIKLLDRLDKTYAQAYTPGQIRSFASQDDKKICPVSKQQFLQRLPKQVIKNGQVINIRDQIAKKLYGFKQQDMLNEEINNGFKKDQDGCLLFENGQSLNQDVGQLKIRSRSGINNFKFNLNRTQTLAEVFYTLSKFYNKPIQLFVPSEGITFGPEEKRTIQECGLFPLSKLFIR